MDTLPFQVSDGAKTVPRLTPDQLATFVDYRKGGDGVRNMSASFDLRALQSAASKAIGSRCTGVTLIAEGGFNQVFILTFSDAVDVIARLHGSSAKQDKGFPEYMITSRFVSEVATLEYLRQNTTIPVPKVYSYDSNPRNPVGSVYMLQERMPGDCLGSNVTALWHHLSFEQRKVIVTQIAMYEAQLLRHRVPYIGRIFRILEPGESDLTHSPRKFPLDNTDFFIGSLGHPFMSDDKFDLQDAGPWTTSAQYVLASIENQLSYVTRYPLECKLKRQKWFAKLGKDDDTSVIPHFQTLFQSLFQSVKTCLNDPSLRLLSDPDPCHFTLHHPDIGVTNVMISYDDTTRVTGIIDWEGAAILPIWAEPTGQRLLNVNDAAETELQIMRRQMLYDQVPDYLPLRAMAWDISLDYLVSIVQYNAVAWMARSQVNELFSEWLGEVATPYQRYFQGLRQIVEADMKSSQ